MKLSKELLFSLLYDDSSLTAPESEVLTDRIIAVMSSDDALATDSMQADRLAVLEVSTGNRLAAIEVKLDQLVNFDKLLGSANESINKRIHQIQTESDRRFVARHDAVSNRLDTIGGTLAELREGLHARGLQVDGLDREQADQYKQLEDIRRRLGNLELLGKGLTDTTDGLRSHVDSLSVRLASQGDAADAEPGDGNGKGSNYRPTVEPYTLRDERGIPVTIGPPDSARHQLAGLLRIIATHEKIELAFFDGIGRHGTDRIFLACRESAIREQREFNARNTPGTTPRDVNGSDGPESQGAPDRSQERLMAIIADLHLHLADILGTFSAYPSLPSRIIGCVGQDSFNLWQHLASKACDRAREVL